jgi:hypothetical protein
VFDPRTVSQKDEAVVTLMVLGALGRAPYPK